LISAAIDKLRQWDCYPLTKELTVIARMTFGSVVIEAEGSEKEVFAELARAAEVFGHTTCRACEGNNVRPSVREVDGNTYYEMHCNDCHAALSFGQTKAGGKLFPRRKKDEHWLPNGGWVTRQAAQSAPKEEPF
jgi:cytochrome c5